MIIAQIESGEMVARDMININIIDIPLIAYIRGGDRAVFQGNPLVIESRIWDPNTDLAYNADPEIELVWSCINLNTQRGCRTNAGEALVLEALYENYVDQNTLEMYSSYVFRVVARKGNRESEASVVYNVVDYEMSMLFVDFAGGVKQRRVSSNELLEFSLKMPTLKTPDEVGMTMQLLYDGLVVASKKCVYSKFRMRVWDYIPTLEEGKKVTLFLTVTGNQPLIFQLTLDVNPGPRGAKVLVTPATGRSMDTLFTVSCKDAVDEQPPFTYQYLIYFGDYHQDVLQGHSDRGVILSNKLLDDTLSIYLPQGDLQLVVRVSDGLGSFTNFTTTVTVQNGRNLENLIKDIAETDDLTKIIVGCYDISLQFE